MLTEWVRANFGLIEATIKPIIYKTKLKYNLIFAPETMVYFFKAKTFLFPLVFVFLFGT